MIHFLTKGLSITTFIIALCCSTYSIKAQGSITATYTNGNIPTSRGDTTDLDCNGPSSTISITLPPGENIAVTGIDIDYDIQSTASNIPAWQRSLIYCQNTSLAEATQSNTNSTFGAIQNYARTDVSIANGTYSGGEILTFEMRVWRIAGTSNSCNEVDQYVTNGSWEITVHYGAPFETPKVGINTEDPESALDINGKLKVGDDNSGVVKGNIRWHEEKNDFQGYDGVAWKSLTDAAKNEILFTSKQDTSNIPVYISNTTLLIHDTMGIIYDSGGPLGNYMDNEYRSIRLYNTNNPNAIGIKITLDSMYLENGYDYLAIDGIQYDQQNGEKLEIFLPSQYQTLINFISDGSVNNAGFKLKFEFLYYDASQSQPDNEKSLSGWTFHPEKLALSGGYQNPNDLITDSLGLYSVSYGSGASAVGSNSISFGLESKSKGDYSFSSGNNSKALGSGSNALGFYNIASGTASNALGDGNTASGYASGAFGYYNTAEGDYSFAIGAYNNASGFNAIALGRNCTASGSNSVAIGSRASTNGYSGSFFFGDGTNTSISHLRNNTKINQFKSRFNEYIFYTNSIATNPVGVQLNFNSNAWTSVSDINKKENFEKINGHIVLNKLSDISLTSWNYKGQDASQYRHYGIMAQDFFKAFGQDSFGTIGCDTLVNPIDMLGIAYIAIQTLDNERKQLKLENEDIKRQLVAVKELINDDLLSLIQELQSDVASLKSGGVTKDNHVKTNHYMNDKKP